MTDPHLPPEKRHVARAAGSFEDLQRTLDPHRDEERQGVEAEATARLGRRGVELTGRERADEIADLIDAIDQFDSAVESRGGDLFVDTPTSRQRDRVERPDNPEYVLPSRNPDESIGSYIKRIGEATARLQ